MKKVFLIAIVILNYSCIIAQQNEIKLISSYSSDNPEISDILQFEGIEYLKLNFQGTELVNKTYHLTVKEIWDGKIKSEEDIVNSTKLYYESARKISDSVFGIKVISKLTHDNKLKMIFKFPEFTINREFDALDSDDYSLRNIAENNKTIIQTGKKFYLLAYILPYEKDGYKYWCAVEDSGKEIEKWGKEFGIKHYLVFEMKFE